MAQRETLKSSDLVIAGWRMAGMSYQITFVDDLPRIETLIGNTWVMHQRSSDVNALLSVFVQLYVRNLQEQTNRCNTEIKLARLEGDQPRRLHWQKMLKKVEHEITNIPAAWGVQWRAKR